MVAESVDIDNNQCFVSTLVNALPYPDPVVYLNEGLDLDPDPDQGIVITVKVKNLLLFFIFFQ
jgi:hypothetical protein